MRKFKELPLGIQTFRDIIEGNFLYVDKTKFIYELVSPSKGIYFLSRPRRFGKSLTISTLKEIFEGNRELFRGLYIYESGYDFKKYPVVRFDFGELAAHSKEQLNIRLEEYIERNARYNRVSLSGKGDALSKLSELIEKLSHKGKVVILIDEYDKPILDNIETIEVAVEIQKGLKDFYTTIKSNDQYLRFLFITGVSKFSKTGVFSGLNNLTDITMNKRFSEFLGYTEDEIDYYFKDYIKEVSRHLKLSYSECRNRLKKWYNGYRFSEKESYVYNPYTTLRFFYDQKFKNYWFETGTPTFLIKLIKDERFDVRELEDLEVSETVFSTYDIENLRLVPILFQTGYLTIKDFDPEYGIYTLSYPNYEVKSSFFEILIKLFSNIEEDFVLPYAVRLIKSLKKEDFENFFKTLNIFFANIPYDLFLAKEKYFQTVFYLIFKFLGLKIDAEVKTNARRIDAVIKIDGKVFFFEFKLGKGSDVAIKQIKEKKYFEKFLNSAGKLYLVGVNFDIEKRRISEWKAEEAKT